MLHALHGDDDRRQTDTSKWLNIKEPNLSEALDTKDQSIMRHEGRWRHATGSWSWREERCHTAHLRQIFPSAAPPTTVPMELASRSSHRIQPKVKSSPVLGCFSHQEIEPVYILSTVQNFKAILIHQHHKEKHVIGPCSSCQSKHTTRVIAEGPGVPQQMVWPQWIPDLNIWSSPGCICIQ